jgi:hypothetical protein
MDKDGLGIKTWGSLGFGYIELGTVTAQPQPGNDKPRLFRLTESRAVINRLGFNNRGAPALAERLAATGISRGNLAVGIPLGISIGKTKKVPLDEAAEDYLAALHADRDLLVEAERAHVQRGGDLRENGDAVDRAHATLYLGQPALRSAEEPSELDLGEAPAAAVVGDSLP